MPSATWSRITIGLFAVLILIVSLVTGQSIDRHGLSWASSAASAVILLLVVYERWAWRWPLLDKLAEAMGHPIIYGTWKAVLKYERDGNGKPGEVVGYFSIYQTFSTVRVRGFFPTSESSSLAATLDSPQPGQKRLVFAYQSQAHHGKRDQNRPHDGLAILNIVGRPVESIDGSYFTDRSGAGTMVLNKHNGQLSDSYRQASRLKYSARLAPL